MLRADPDHRLQPAAIDAALRLDREAGLEPFVVVGTAGCTSTGSVDPLNDLADVAQREGLWFHVDGAYGAPARLTPQGADLLAGIERADSLVLDPHKWLFQPYEIGAVLTPHAGLLQHAFTLDGAYLRDTKGGVVEFRERGPQLTRGARALKLYLSLRTFGLDAFKAAIARGIALAEYAQTLLERDARVGGRLARDARGDLLPPRRPRRRADGLDGALGRRGRLHRAQHDDPGRADGRAPVHDQPAHHRTRHRGHDRALDALLALRHLNTQARRSLDLTSVRSGTFGHEGSRKRVEGRWSRVNGRRAGAAAWAALAISMAVPAMAGAAPPPLVVDDDGQDCPAAPYRTIQNAIFAAPDGATIAVCPGEYVEGGGGVGSNGLIIIRDVTIKGAGADLVTIKPRAVRANGGQIAETANPSIRNSVGAIVMIDGADTQYAPLAPAAEQTAAGTRRLNRLKSNLLTVNISGVTIDGDGVYADAGIVFRDAQGSITRSRVTNIVTSETSYDTPRAGEYKGSNDGYAIASVTAPPLDAGRPRRADTAPLPTVPRIIKVDHSRIDKYNKAGILLDGATGDTLPLTASGITSQGILGQNQIVGRTVCVNFEVNGNCSNPQIATNGPLYGQDGVRVTAGSSVTVTETLVSQNLVQGTLAPTRGAAANNANLSLGAGIRLIGGAASVLSKNNIVDNSYGVFNVGLDGVTPNTAVPVRAENNWWGLRPASAGGGANNGPAISPTTNPPIPENPVNGAAAADPSLGSDTVDFFPFRNGPQSDPNTGEFAVYDAPGVVNDTVPTVGLTTDKATYHRGDTATLTAAAGDDFGVRVVSFYDGPWMVGRADRKPYEVEYTLPSDIACASRTLTAVVEDSSGQTNSTSTAIEIDSADCTPAGPSRRRADRAPPTAPSVAFVNAPLTLPTTGSDIVVAPNAPLGLKQVDVFLGATRICTLTTTFTCRVTPGGGDVGIQELRAVISDNAGNTSLATTRVEVPHFKAKSLTVTTKSANRPGNKVLKTITAEIVLPDRVSRSQGCANGSITLITKRAGKIIDDSQIALNGSCKVTKKITATRAGKNGFSVSARFAGNRVLDPISAKTRRFS